MPLLTFGDQPAGGGKDGYRELYVKNVGYGPALNIVRKIIQKASRVLHIRDEFSCSINRPPSEVPFKLSVEVPRVACVESFHCADIVSQIVDGEFERKIKIDAKNWNRDKDRVSSFLRLSPRNLYEQLKEIIPGKLQLAPVISSGDQACDECN